MKRAVSSLILGFLISTIMLSILMYIFMDIQRYRAAYTSSYENIAKYISRYSDINIDVTTFGGTVIIRNMGLRDTAIEYLVLEKNNGIQINKTFIALSPGNIISIDLGSWNLVSIVTSDGMVFHPSKQNVETPRTDVVPVTSITFNNIRYTDDLTEEFGVPPNMVSTAYTRDRRDIYGMTGERLLLLPAGQQQGIWNSSTPFSVYTDDSGIRFGVAVIGYDPIWVAKNASGIKTPPQFRIMIAGPAFTGQDKIYIDRTNPLTGGRGFRLFINNFTGVIKICRGECSSSNVIACSSSLPGYCGNAARNATGFWYYGSTDSDLNLRLYINGLATYAAYYMRISSDQAGVGETSYNPYLFIGDIDGNGLSDIVFVTEDAYYGSYNSIDDYYDNNDLSDWSTVPLRLVLLQVGRSLGSIDGSIDGSQYAGVYLLLNIFFHDNSYPDEQQLQDIYRTDWVLRVVLVGEDGSTYIVREYGYPELCNYHKTRITDFIDDNYFVKISQSIYVSIPPTGRYWIAIEFQDPYSKELVPIEYRYPGGGRRRVNFSYNDVDVTVGIEFIGAIAFLR